MYARTHIFLRIYVCIHVYIYTYIHTNIHTYRYVHIYTRTHARTHTHTHTQGASGACKQQSRRRLMPLLCLLVLCRRSRPRVLSMPLIFTYIQYDYVGYK